jgi:hypothetical protein
MGAAIGHSPFDRAVGTKGQHVESFDVMCVK